MATCQICLVKIILENRLHLRKIRQIEIEWAVLVEILTKDLSMPLLVRSTKVEMEINLLFKGEIAIQD